MDPLTALVRRGGAARRSDLIREVPARALEAALRQGLATRPHRGVYALPNAPRDVVIAALLRGNLTCVSLAKHLGLPVPDDPHSHVSIRSKQSQSGRNATAPKGTVIHRVDESLGPYVMMLAHAARCLARPDLLALADAALARGLVTRELMAAAAGRRSRLTWIASHVSPLAGSPLESLARCDLMTARLPFVEQARIEGVGRVDFLVAHKLIVEIDGRAFHSDPASFATDRLRDRRAAALGYATIRFTAADVRGGIAADVRSVLHAKPPQRRPGSEVTLATPQTPDHRIADG